MENTYYTLPFVPNQSSYVVQDSAKEALYVQLDGGAPKIRRDILNAWKLVNVAWTISKAEYDKLERFYRVVGTYIAGTQFVGNLIIDSYELRPFLCLFVPNTFKLNNVRGLTYNVSAQLFVKPTIYDEEYEIGLLTMEDSYGDQEEGLIILNMLHILANIKIPLGAEVK